MPDLPSLEPIDLNGYRLDVGHYLTKEYTAIADAAAEIPAILEWINDCFQLYTEQRHTTEAELEETEAKVYFDLTSPGEGGFAANYHGKMTAEALKHALALDPGVKALKRKVATLSAWCSRLSNLRYTFQSRLELIRSTEATRRVIERDLPPTA